MIVSNVGLADYVPVLNPHSTRSHIDIDHGGMQIVPSHQQTYGSRKKDWHLRMPPICRKYMIPYCK